MSEPQDAAGARQDPGTGAPHPEGDGIAVDIATRAGLVTVVFTSAASASARPPGTAFSCTLPALHRQGVPGGAVLARHPRPRPRADHHRGPRTRAMTPFPAREDQPGRLPAGGTFPVMYGRLGRRIPDKGAAPGRPLAKVLRVPWGSPARCMTSQ